MGLLRRTSALVLLTIGFADADSARMMRNGEAV